MAVRALLTRIAGKVCFPWQFGFLPESELGDAVLLLESAALHAVGRFCQAGLIFVGFRAAFPSVSSAWIFLMPKGLEVPEHCFRASWCCCSSNIWRCGSVGRQLESLLVPAKTRPSCCGRHHPGMLPKTCCGESGPAGGAPGGLGPKVVDRGMVHHRGGGGEAHLLDLGRRRFGAQSRLERCVWVDQVRQVVATLEKPCRSGAR